MRSLKVPALILIIFILNGVIVSGEETGRLSVSLSPSGVMPLGNSSESFGFGGGGGLSADLRLGTMPLFFFRLDSSYNYIPIVTKDAVSVYSVTTGGGITYSPLTRLNFRAYGTGGYFYSALTGDSGIAGGNIALKGGLSASYNITPSFAIGLDAYYFYNYYLNQGMGVSLSASYTFPINMEIKPRIKNTLPSKPQPLKEEKPAIKRTGKGLEIIEIDLEKIFPVLFKHYDSSPVGKAVIYNNESSPVSDVVLSLYVERYMDNPKECAVTGSIGSKEEREVDLYALFSDSVLEITEGTKVSAKITLEYTYKGKSKRKEYTQSMELYDRNATTWDDDRKAAAFVTAKDPAVLAFSKKVAGWTKNSGSRAVNANLSMAMGIHEALRLYGLSYVVDPKTPFAEYSKNKLSVDFLQFPRQTLNYTAGDCDDLSILYSALLESVGIETAFITIPGHIFVAFSLDMDPDTARKSFLRPDELIYEGGKTWLPVEITMVAEPFLKAWETGAKEWRENNARNQADMFPMHDCWKVYTPVGLSGTENVSMPGRMEVVNAFQAEIIRFIDREIYPKVSELQAKIKESDNSARYVNRLGVLYAKYGLNDKAERQFKKILQKTTYVPALLNMGNLRYLKKDIKGALEYYQKASNKEPNNPKVLLSIARASHELENYGTVKDSYEMLKSIDPDLAEQFSYLALRGEEASRAAEISKAREVMVWDED